MSEATARSGRSSGWVLPLVVLIVGMFMSVLDTSIVNVAIPRMQTSLSASTEDIRWVVTGYTLALGVIVPLSSWLGDRFGATRVYLGSLLGFTVASALCGMAWDLSSMITFRVIQAIPGGVLPVITMTMLYRIVPMESIGAAMGLYGFGVVFAPAVGPTLGGYLVEYVDWRLIFYINVPIGILGAVAALAVFPRIQPTSWPRFDLWGFVTSAYGLFALLLATDKGEDWGWTSYRVLILLVSSALSLALFVVIELEVDAPLLDVRVFKVWPYTNSLLLISVISIGLFTSLYYIPQFLQVIQGLQALNSGLVLMPSALVMVVLMPIAGKLYDRFGPRWPAVIGLSLTAYGSFLLAQITPDVPRAQIILWTTIRNIGIGLSMMPIMTAGVAALAAAQVSVGSALNNVVQRVSASLGLAVFGGLITAQQAQFMADRGSMMSSGPNALPEIAEAEQRGPEGLLPYYMQLQKDATTTAYANMFIMVTGLCVVGVVLAFLLRHGKATRAAAPPPPEPKRPTPTVPAPPPDRTEVHV
ncbi:DHA2 family efflux MFS transporter permease subunit [Pseudonocardia acaciae]|uniref:DHA2 family efflux MFS transporter permease subunit n=1 Tax=Pseudonocardia acaciae TaxID=551276 RepID=UPI000A018CC6|nr:DHA2 family efflux MFS transporter permease subunit [Pseudonocardia acaciae]